MLDLTTIKITHRDEQVLKLLVQGCSNKEIAAQLNIKSSNGETAPAHALPAGGNSRWAQACEACDRNVCEGADKSCNLVSG